MSAVPSSSSGQPTPPRGELAYELHHVARHNAGYAHHRDEDSAWGSAYPAPSTIEPGFDYHAEDLDQDDHHPLDTYYHANHQYPFDSFHTRTPPTPISNSTSDSRRTRSGRISRRTDSPMSSVRDDRSRVTKSPLSVKKGRKSKSQTFELPLPLSILTKDSKKPIKDMRAHINRPVEIRIKEARDRQEKKNKGNKGVPRPMNSFMLYRSAYAERCKEWAYQNNHQVVSSISGASWPMETADVREFYTELAEEERIKHREAHPSYKFTPSKPASGLTAKEDDYDDGGFSDDPDGEYVPSRGQARQARRRPEQSAQQETSPYVHQHYAQPSPSNINMSTWSFNNPTRPMPAPDQVQPYPFQAQVQQHSLYDGHGYGYGYGQVEDVRVTMNPSSAASYSGHGLVSLPGGGHQDLLQPQTHNTLQQYQQPQMGGNFIDVNGMLYPDQSVPQMDIKYDMSAGQNSGFGEPFQQGLPQADMHSTEWQLDPALAPGFDEYGQFLE
ncbi:hypothetical protein MBLNU459_g6875t1 [Dothideomycetes sp. NU459]